MSYVQIALLSEVPEGTLTEIIYRDAPYAICNVGGDVRVLHGTCPHQGGPLGQGALDEGIVTCPWHAWEFDSATGKCEFLSGPTIPVYPVRIEDGAVLADLPDA